MLLQFAPYICHFYRHNFSYLFYIIVILLLIYVSFFGIKSSGSKRWMDLPFLPRFQPVEFVKPLFIIFVAKIIVINDKLNIYYRYLYSFAVLILITIFLINQPDLGQTLLLVSSWITMIFVSGFNMIVLSFFVYLLNFRRLSNVMCFMWFHVFSCVFMCFCMFFYMSVASCPERRRYCVPPPPAPPRRGL